MPTCVILAFTTGSFTSAGYSTGRLIAIAYAKAGEYDKDLQIAADTTYNDRVKTLAANATQSSKAGQAKRAKAWTFPHLP